MLMGFAFGVIVLLAGAAVICLTNDLWEDES